MNYTAEIIASLITGGAYLALFAGVELWSRWRSPDVEITRKTVHCAGGLIALSFPLLFQSPWTVVLLGLLFAAMLAATKRSGLLRSVQGVERITLGEIVYPVAIATTYLLSSIAGGADIYTLAILILAFSDAAAGVIGKRHGRRLYTVWGERKSVEGSAAFYVTTLLIVATGLVIAGDHAVPRALLMAQMAALLLTGVEAISPRGIDNLSVPIAAWAVLLLAADIEPGLLIPLAGLPTIIAAGLVRRGRRIGRGSATPVHNESGGAS